VTTKLDNERIQKDKELSRKLIIEMDKEKQISSEEFSLLLAPRY
jgi:hypothetical protein